MLMELIVSTCIFFIFLVFGNIMLFIDTFAYTLLIPYFIMCALLYRVYNENCKSIEGKDFIFTLLIVLVEISIYYAFDYTINLDIFSYLCLSTFVPFLSFATTIRFKSLM